MAATIDAGLLRTAAEKKNDEEILMHIRDKDCVALEVHYHGICYNNYTKFITKPVKEANTCAPIYEKSYKVFCKDVIELEVIKGKAIKYMKELLSKFIVIVKETEKVDASKYRAFSLKQRLINSYPQLVFLMQKYRTVGEIVYAENLRPSDFVGEHMLNKSIHDDEVGN